MSDFKSESDDWKGFYDSYIASNSKLSLFFIGLAIFGFLLILLPSLFQSTSFKDLGPMGDLVGGILNPIIGIAAALLTFLAFYVQYQANLQVQKQFGIQQFENQFFEMLRLHRANVQELRNNSGNGRKEFHKIFMQFLKCKEEILPFFKRKTEKNIYNKNYLEKLKSELKYSNPNLDLKQLAKIGLPYAIIYYGVGPTGMASLVDILKNYYKPSFFIPILDYLAMKPVKSSKFYERWEENSKVSNFKKRVAIFEAIRRIRNNEKIESIYEQQIVEKASKLSYSSDYTKYYGGHQFKLGHYFRHLFQSFKFINQSKHPQPTKYFYCKTLRAQLSTFEQALLFANSLSFLGLIWDLTPEISASGEIDYLEEKRLITKYNLIKNLPGKDIYGITYRDFYPDVDYEFQ